MKKLYLILFLLIANQLFGQISVSLHHYDYYDFSALCQKANAGYTGMRIR